MTSATAIAHPNIALAKYWGKAPGLDNAPAVPSLSVTLAGLSTRTTVTFDATLDRDVVELNGTVAEGKPRDRAVALLDRIRARAGSTLHARVVSSNDFPTAAGLASSASGFAALAVAALGAAGLPIDRADASDLARRSSASAARSVFGGWVELPAGTTDRETLPAAEIAPPEHLDLRLLVAVTTERAKDVGSTEGMNRTAAESPFYAAWLDAAPQLFSRVKSALLARDLPALGAAAEASALAMHASAIAAGVVYWNGVTIEALRTVRELRARGIGTWATIDAGPHLKAIVAPSDATAVKAALAAVPGVLRVLETQPGPGARIVERT